VQAARLKGRYHLNRAIEVPERACRLRYLFYYVLCMKVFKAIETMITKISIVKHDNIFVITTQSRKNGIMFKKISF
jgi:hypothetical protein